MIYWQLFLEFFKIGLFCFGGAFGMIPLIRETVLAHQWLSESDFMNLIGVCESTPGPIAVNTATFIGAVQGGILGSLCATLGVVLPSFLIILLIASVFKKCTQNPYFKRFMKGVKPVIIALILSTGITLLWSTLGISFADAFSADWISIVIFALLTATYAVIQKCFRKKLSSVQLILLSAGLGILIAYPLS